MIVETDAVLIVF